MILVKILNIDSIELIKFLIYKGIKYKGLTIYNNYITIIINKDDYNIISKYYSIEIIKEYGINGIKLFIKKHYIFILSFIFSLIIIEVLSNIIFSIDIITSNDKVKESINDILISNNIEKYKFVKSEEYINKVKEEILESNKDTIEWISIERIGTKYTVNVIERVINNNVVNNTPSNIIASKDGMIKKIILKSGVIVKEVNELVKEGDIIVTGNITKNEEVMDSVRSEAIVYGEVWYTVNISIPFKHIEYTSTNEYINHIYLDIFGKKFTLMGKYETNNSINKTKLLIDKPYLLFKIYNERKELFTYKEVNLSVDEAYNEALKRSERSILEKLDTDEYILDKKVLKKNVYSSKIELEVFYSVYENIGIEGELDG